MVSVIIPYNRDRGYLQDAINSVFYSGECEILLSQSDNNCAYNINRGLKIAKGEYIKILAEDDMLTPNSLRILVKGIQGYDFVYADAENFGDLDGWPERSYDKTVTLESMLQGNGINGGGCLYRTEILRAAGGWDESLWTAEEYDLHLRLIKAGYKHRHVPGIVYRYRRHGDNKSGKDREARHKLINQIRQRYV
jgi:GT2 family glycosyltransferase